MIAVGGKHVDAGAADVGDGDIKGAAAQIVDHNVLILAARQPIGDDGGSRLVNDLEHLEPRRSACAESRLALAVIEIGGHGDDGAVDLDMIGRRDVPHELLQEDAGERLGGTFFTVDESGPLRVPHHALIERHCVDIARFLLLLGVFADERPAAFHTDDGWRAVLPHAVFENAHATRLLAEGRDGGVRCPQIDSDVDFHSFSPVNGADMKNRTADRTGYTRRSSADRISFNEASCRPRNSCLPGWLRRSFSWATCDRPCPSPDR